MQISDKGIEFIKSHEGLRLEAYNDGVGVPTIGYGHTSNVSYGDIITEDKALDFLRNDVLVAENEVKNNVTVALNQNQYDALVSLVFNLGGYSIFRKVYNNGYQKGSSLFNLLQQGKYNETAERFTDFVKGGGNFMQGLYNRRIKEKELFLKQTFFFRESFCCVCGVTYDINITKK